MSTNAINRKIAGNPTARTEGASVSLFSGPDEHAANPPQTWIVTRSDRPSTRRWNLCTAAGDVLDSYPTRRDAEAARTSGFLADLYADETRWYAGEPVRGWIPYRALRADEANTRTA